MNTERKVSVIITAYNQKELVCQSIDSILDQTYENIEIIVVDDGSSDETGPYLNERYPDTIQYFYQSNQGQAAARNHGLRRATGYYVQFLDGDDLLLPDKIQKQIRLLEERPEYQAAYCDYACFTDREPQKWIPGIYKDRYISGNLWPSLVEGNLLLSHTPLIPLHMAKGVGGFDEDRTLSGCEDYDFWLRLSRSGCDFIYLDEVLVLYRQVESSVSKDHKGQELRSIKILEKVHKNTDDLNREERKAVTQYLVRLNIIVGYRMLWTGAPAMGVWRFVRALTYHPLLVLKLIRKYYYYVNLRD